MSYRLGALVHTLYRVVLWEAFLKSREITISRK